MAKTNITIKKDKILFSTPITKSNFIETKGFWTLNMELSFNNSVIYLN